MTVFENVAFGLRVRHKSTRPSKEEIRDRVERLLSLVQLAQFSKRYPSQLSGGQRQRVALARALAVEPKVLLLDEPFGALDAQVRKGLRAWLRRLHEEIHITSVLVTHDQEEALEVADRVVVMNNSKIEQEGTPDEVFHNAKTGKTVVDGSSTAPLAAREDSFELASADSTGGLYGWRGTKDNASNEGFRAPIVLRWISEQLELEAKAGRLSDQRLQTIDANLTAFNDALGGAERILKTPIPFAYAQHIKIFVILFCYTVPFALSEALQQYTWIAVAALAFALFGIDEIGVEIEDPFGYDPNDLPVDAIGDTIDASLRDIEAVGGHSRGGPIAT